MDNDMIRISEDDDSEELLGCAEPWVVICADDDESTHRSTQFALDGELIEGRSVLLVSAYSAKEAIEAVKSHPEAAALLLDVVMETSTAGLDVIAVIRDQLKRDSLRIIVRSGAPGLLSELETVKKYDITDWRPKNELNQSRLLSAITLAVRSHAELGRLDKKGQSLDSAMSYLERLATDPESDELFSDILEELEKSCGFPVWSQLKAPNGSWMSSIDAGGGKRGCLWRHASDGEAAPDLSELGRRAVRLIDLKVAGELLAMSLWIEDGADEAALDQEQSKALLRALAAAYSGRYRAQKERESLIRDQATGLLSRMGFLDWALKNPLPDGTALYLVDLAGFARVNSALGHEAGDDILKQAGQRLASFCRPHPCARIASDAFAMLMPSAKYDPVAFEKAFDEPLMARQFPIPMKPRVAAVEALGSDAKEWLTRAAAAMEEAKQAGLSGGAPKWFDKSSKSAALERMELSQKLFVALRDRVGLYMVYQPQVGFEDGKPTGCEALIRWRHPIDGFIGPDKFIPIAEQSGLAMAVSEFALSESLAMMRKARELQLPIPRVSVNLSPVEFEIRGIKQRVLSHLADSGCKPTDLMVEITETAAAKDPDRMTQILTELRGEGIKVAIDDFGSGYSSLAHLARLPIDELKIDRAFVSALGQDGPFSGIAKMIVDLGRSMRLEVVAEGVESEEQANLLRLMGAQSAQGWLYAKAMPQEEFFAWLSST